MKEVLEELLKPGFNSFGLGDCKAPKVLGDIVESIAGAIFLDSGRDTSVVWQVSFFMMNQSSFLYHPPLFCSFIYLFIYSFFCLFFP